MGRVLRRQFALVVLALAVARAAAAQTGSISGTVSGPPSTTVHAYTATAQLADATSVVTTDVDFSTHQYTLSGLAPGTYFVRTTAPTINSPFVDQWYPAIPVASSGARPQRVTVTAGATTSGIDFALTQVSGSISGSVTLATLPFRGGLLNCPASRSTTTPTSWLGWHRSSDFGGLGGRTAGHRSSPRRHVDVDGCRSSERTLRQDLQPRSVRGKQRTHRRRQRRLVGG